MVLRQGTSHRASKLRQSQFCPACCTVTCARAPRHGNSRLRKNRTKQGDGVFVIRSLTRTTPRETDLRYDELASGATIYAYVGNDPLSGIDPLGLDTFQIGFSFTYSFKIPWTSIGAAGTAGVGAAFDTTGQIATYGYYGGAAAYGTFGANGGVQFAGSNADTVQDLGGKFNDYSLTAADGPGGSLGYFSGKNADGCKNVKGGSLTIGGGTPGGYLSVGQTNTYIGPVGHLW